MKYIITEKNTVISNQKNLNEQRHAVIRIKQGHNQCIIVQYVVFIPL